MLTRILAVAFIALGGLITTPDTALAGGTRCETTELAEDLEMVQCCRVEVDDPTYTCCAGLWFEDRLITMLCEEFEREVPTVYAE